MKVDWVCINCYINHRKSGMDKEKSEELATFSVESNKIDMGVCCPHCTPTPKNNKCMSKEDLGDRIEDVAKESEDYS